MYKPKRYIRLDQLFAMPTVTDCRRLLNEAMKTRGCTIELPWRSQKTYIAYSLTARVELGGGEPLWTLYEGEGNRSRVVWSSPFEDIELMCDVLHLSLPGEEVSTSLTPQPAAQQTTAQQSQSEPTPAATQSYSASIAEDAHGIKRPSLGPDFFVGGVQDYQRSSKKDNGAPTTSPNPTPNPTITPVTQPGDGQSQQTQLPATNSPVPQPPPAVAPPPIYPPYGAPVQPGYQYPPGYPPQFSGYPAGYPPQTGYPMYPPGYPVDPRYYQQPPYTPPTGYAQPAGTLPVVPGTTSPAPPVAESAPGAGQAMKPDADLMRKRPNILLGNFLIEAGLIPETTLQAALQLQDMVKNGMFKTALAAEAVRRAHERGGAIEQAYFTATPNPVIDTRDARGVCPPLGQILVEAGLIHMGALKAALNLQEVVRTGAMTKEDALSSFIKEHFGADEKPEEKREREAEQAIDLLRQAGLIHEKDVEAARSVKRRHGGNIAKILAAAGKLDNKTFEAAMRCKELMKEERLRVEQTMIVLNYCQRSRMTFDEAIEELGWAQP